MHQRGQQRQLTLSLSRSGASARRSHSVLLVAGLLGVVGIGSAGCGDDDTTDMNVGGGAGTAGRGGSAGSAGRGGSAGSAGSAGNAGNAGNAGTGGTSGNSYDRQAIATAICANMAATAAAASQVDAGAPLDAGSDAGSDAAATPSCSPPPDCVNLYAGADGPLAFADALPPACTDEVLDFWQCLGNADANSFVCVNGVVEVAYGANACPNEEAAFLSIDGTNCPAD
jgi:hypothetical protein